MSATVDIAESNGSGPTVTGAIANLNFGSSDGANLTTSSNKIIKGNRSYEKYIRLRVSALGGSSSISNIYSWKSAGAYVTGEQIYSNWGASTYNDVSYVQPVSAVSTAATIALPTAQPTTGGRWKIGGSQTGAITTASPTYSDYVALQMSTTASTPSGVVNAKTFSFQFDES